MTSGKNRSENLCGIGSFGGLFDISKLNYKEPVLVSSIDGVGTKLTIAQMMNKHDTVGIDIVSHCVNDILVQGAKPVFFTDYIGCGKLDADVMSKVIEGIVTTCANADCELLGGETAEMPGMYKPGEYDLVGSITGIVEKSKIISGKSIQKGDCLIGLPSSGLHTNGYSLARKIVFEIMNFNVNSRVDMLDCTVGEALLIPHRCYSPLYDLFNVLEIKGLAHITGGGITENLPRVLPEGIGARIDKSSIHTQAIFKLLQDWGNVLESEMYRVFNMGTGMILVVSKNDVSACMDFCRKIYPDTEVIGETIESDVKEIVYY